MNAMNQYSSADEVALNYKRAKEIWKWDVIFEDAHFRFLFG